ncbi:MAG: hypothetical protein AAF349_00075 [Cyanobacteria bacterium P01_A01_bin.68]
MKNDIIKQQLREHLKSPEKETFNREILQQLNGISKKRRPPVFNEQGILYWFLFIAGFVLFFYAQHASRPDGNAILIGSMVSAIPLYLMVFNKIYSLKK